jgi:hypothetical protein
VCQQKHKGVKSIALKNSKIRKAVADGSRLKQAAIDAGKPLIHVRRYELKDAHEDQKERQKRRTEHPQDANSTEPAPTTVFSSPHPEPMRSFDGDSEGDDDDDNAGPGTTA